MVSDSKDPLTFNDLMATPMTSPSTCSSSIELEYNFQECFNALTDKLDWNNPNGDRYPYGHLEEVVVKRSDQQLYKFKEGDFVDLHLNEIEDMLLLAVQHKLFHLDRSDVVDFIMTLLMFTRSLILKRRVEDLQLGVESYQKKLNITKPQKTFQGIKFTEPYTPSYDPPGIAYEDLNKQKRVLRADELYKFLDGTLKSVRNEIHHRVLDFCLEYNKEMPKRKWTVVD
ncbi:hypothetical protein Tco_0752399 [Tanacetum coccineum]|uniref:Uncharacterized protein n=1 Tax=Tanacetum coccineum TaxID=301880 RepID=A0ABQ4Z6Q3_9ASTR